jgi:monoamine oxidase
MSMWGTDPWSRGAYSHVLPGQGDPASGARARLSRPAEDRIFVAGEATSPDFYGTAHGAWMEGERAAREALGRLGVETRPVEIEA